MPRVVLDDGDGCQAASPLAEGVTASASSTSSWTGIP
jgi:hypothetical protein